jgi:predicted nucleic acid-binding protein
MANESVLVDAGPLVALLSKSDSEHQRCVDQSQTLPKPFVTTWPVLTEAAWLLRKEPQAISRLLALIEAELVNCVHLDKSAAAEMTRLAIKYADLKPQIADLSLVYVATLLGSKTIFTLDRRDFSIFRDSHGNAFNLIP